MKQETKVIKDFLKRIGLKHIKVRSAQLTECDTTNDIIYFSMAWYDEKSYKEHKKIYADIYKSKGYKINVSMATFTLFHEIGHILSKLELKTTNNDYLKAVSKLPRDKGLKTMLMAYREILDEKLADEWGYLLYKKCEKRAEVLDRELQALTH